MPKFDPSTLKYDQNGLIPAIAQDASTREVLMMAWMNADAVSRTLKTGHVTYWSRSRTEFWEKGLTSGHRQHLVEMRIDCDRDCILMTVEQIGPACHTNRKSCFYIGISDEAEVELSQPMR